MSTHPKGARPVSQAPMRVASEKNKVIPGIGNIDRNQKNLPLGVVVSEGGDYVLKS